jgi:hypothetical protein
MAYLVFVADIVTPWTDKVSLVCVSGALGVASSKVNRGRQA